MKYLILVTLAVLASGCGKEEPGKEVQTQYVQGDTVVQKEYVDPPLNDPQFIVPCKKDTTKIPQVIVYSNGSFFTADGNKGDNVTYSLLGMGPHITNDGRNCSFMIDANGYHE